MSKKVLSFEEGRIRLALKAFIRQKAKQHNLPRKEIQVIVDDCFSYGEISVLNEKDMEYLSHRVAVYALNYHMGRYF